MIFECPKEVMSAWLEEIVGTPDGGQVSGVSPGVCCRKSFKEATSKGQSTSRHSPKDTKSGGYIMNAQNRTHS